MMPRNRSPRSPTPWIVRNPAKVRHRRRKLEICPSCSPCSAIKEIRNWIQNAYRLGFGNERHDLCYLTERNAALEECERHWHPKLSGTPSSQGSVCSKGEGEPHVLA